jgi:tetratricopeptide (TPR) repeat protein
LNVIASVDYWRQACLADPQEATAGFGLGYGLIQLGDLGGALQAFDQSLQNARQAKDQHGTSIAFYSIGDVLVAQGDGAGALAAYQAGLTIREGLAQLDPANTQWQEDVAASCAKLGSNVAGWALPAGGQLDACPALSNTGINHARSCATTSGSGRASSSLRFRKARRTHSEGGTPTTPIHP